MTNFIKNTWYTAGWSSEIGAKPAHRKIIGEHVVLYRGESGNLIALEEKCPHRFAPLHKGKIIGDLIECPYHGLRFGDNGKCVYNPFDPNFSPPNATVKTYSVVEKDTLIWIWMGEEPLASPEDIPDYHWLNETDKYAMTSEGMIEMPVNYELIIDNLLDLSHGQFLHPTTLGNTAMAGGTTDSRKEGNTVHSDRLNYDGYMPTLFNNNGVIPNETKVDYWNDLRWDPAGSYYLEVGITPAGEPREKGVYIGSAQLLTPIDEATTAYRFILFRTFMKDSEELTRGIEALVMKAFVEEDEPMIADVQKRMNGKDFWSLRPAILEGDRAAIFARRILEKLARDEENSQGECLD